MSNPEFVRVAASEKTDQRNHHVVGIRRCGEPRFPLLEPEQQFGAIYKLHRGERSNDLRRLPTASCRQCQTSALAFEGDMPAFFLDSFLLVCRWDDATEMVLAFASCQCCSATFLIVSGPADGASVGIVFAGETIFSVSTRVLGSSSLSDLANSFGAGSGSVLR